jgi:glycosyltransferase involved in cell wall biosynthesis
MKISIIVPTFNRSHLLPKAITDILNQSYGDFELLIIDNFSEDNTEKAVKKFMEKDRRVKYYKNHNYGIIQVNRNFGIQKASGEFVAFCDDDDLWLPLKLEKQLVEFQKDPKLGLVGTCGKIINDYTKLESKYDTKGGYISFNKLLRKNPIIDCSAMVRKEVFENVGLLDETPETCGVDDYELWLRIAQKYKVKIVNMPLVKYRVHQSYWSGNLNTRKGIENFHLQS